MNVPFNYAEPPDVPEGMTLEAYRRARARPVRRRRLLGRLRRRGGGTSPARALARH
jgi:hypothetical protein